MRVAEQRRLRPEETQRATWDDGANRRLGVLVARGQVRRSLFQVAYRLSYYGPCLVRDL